MNDLRVPAYVLEIMNGLRGFGYEAYAVGGCVRDTLMNKVPHDWDVTTSALPVQIKAALPGYKIIDVGIKHGTVCVVADGNNVEVTTFRTDGEYADNRHPSAVSFTSRLADDLARRDFTVNAMAYSPETGITDIFSGMHDIENGVIRCVGNPGERFNEDALRILRGLRFASALGFEIEAETAEAIHSCCGLLKNISAERIHNELDRLLCGVNAEKLLEEYADVFCVFIPEISESVNFKQYGEKHAFDVWRHICRTVGVVQNDRILRLTMLLHDLGKPRTHVLNSAGESTFPEHAPVGAQIAEAVLRRLRYDKKTITAVSRLVKYHDFEIPADKVCAKKLLRLVSPDEYLQLLEIKRADRFALSEKYRDVSQKLARARELLSEILENGECYSLDTLAIGGDALKAAGIKSEAVGKCLDFLLERVIDGTLANEKSALLGALDSNKV